MWLKMETRAFYTIKAAVLWFDSRSNHFLPNLFAYQARYLLLENRFRKLLILQFGVSSENAIWKTAEKCLSAIWKHLFVDLEFHSVIILLVFFRKFSFRFGWYLQTSDAAWQKRDRLYSVLGYYNFSAKQNAKNK